MLLTCRGNEPDQTVTINGQVMCVCGIGRRYGYNTEITNPFSKHREKRRHENPIFHLNENQHQLLDMENIRNSFFVFAGWRQCFWKASKPKWISWFLWGFKVVLPAESSVWLQHANYGQWCQLRLCFIFAPTLIGGFLFSCSVDTFPLLFF